MNDEPFSTKTPYSSLPVFSQFNSCFLVLRTNILKNAISAVLPLVSFCQNFLAMLVSFSKIRVKHTSSGARCKARQENGPDIGPGARCLPTDSDPNLVGSAIIAVPNF